MTLEEFRNIANNEWDVGDLMHFCWDNNYDDLVEDIYSSDGYDEYIGSCVDDYARDHSWRDLGDYIDGFQDPYEYNYWIEDGWGDFIGLETGDDNFIELVNELERHLIEDDFFELGDEDEEDEYDEYIADDSTDDLVVSVESVSIMYGWVV